MSYTVVIVDDEKMISEGIASLFPWNQIGFQAVSFSDARLALGYIKSNHVDVLLSDIEMPGMNGIELCEEVKDLGIIVVFISSHQNYDYFRSAIQYHIEDYILKPIKSSDILQCFGKIKDKLDAVNKIDEAKPESYYDNIRKSVEQYLEKEYKDAKLEQAAVLVNLSPAYLSKLLRDKFGTGFSDWLLEIRMKKAAGMLTDVNYKSYDIAYYIGYDNPKSFSRAFKNYYGMTPMEYRSGKTKQD